MNKKILPFIVLSVLLLVGVVFFFRPHSAQAPEAVIPTPYSTETMTQFDQSISDGVIAFGYASALFGLAITSEQILVHSYIPPCDSEFIYCLYFNSDMYKGTNFESAGLRIQKRVDLITSRACMNTPPEGYVAFIPRIATSTNYMVSIFAPLGNGAAGHYASGSLYRLFSHHTCYEFETRIGTSQYMNYPEGTIKKFTEVDTTAVELFLQGVLEHVTLPSGEKVFFHKEVL